MKYPAAHPNGFRINGGAWHPSQTPQTDATALIATLPDGSYTVEWRCETQHPSEGRFTITRPEPEQGPVE